MVPLITAAACGSSTQRPFAWLAPRAAPHGWITIAVPTGARLSYPPGWQRVRGDRGTASAALLGPDRRYIGYLNITPRQGAETIADWPSFRIAHNADEGDRHVTRLAAAKGLRFLGGTGACVKDSYTTQVGARYIEIACIVAAATRTSVIVAAAPPGSWARVSPALERAISAFTA